MIVVQVLRSTLCCKHFMGYCGQPRPITPHRSWETFSHAVEWRESRWKMAGYISSVMVIVAGIGHGDTSSNPGLIAFHIILIPLGKV